MIFIILFVTAFLIIISTSLFVHGTRQKPLGGRAENGRDIPPVGA